MKIARKIILSVMMCFMLVTVFTACGCNEDKVYTATLVLDGGNWFDNDDSETVDIRFKEDDNNPIFERKPTREGWIFDGWFLDDNFTVEYTELTDTETSFTIYAKWTDNFKLTSDNFREWFNVSLSHNFSSQKLNGEISPKYDFVSEMSPEIINIKIEVYYIKQVYVGGSISHES